ncbi:hypothetical protein ACHBIF_05785 [Streptococcus sp. A11]|uniref:hypothetical protein n=1 Tax=Streptococcus sp. A11 TaxID=3373124 RepID=UPI00374CCA10
MFNDELDILEVNYSRLNEASEEGQLQASYSIARNMLTKHMSDEDIAELTALPLTTIAQLRSQLEIGA